ncbi:MAG: DUF2752 domain-containing protein [Cytophagaceae bacterium]
MILSRNIRIIIQYIACNIYFFIAGVYVSGSIALKEFIGIDCTVPCLFYSVFKVKCWGCGLSHAFACLLRLNFSCAWEENPLIYLVIPSVTYFILSDYLKFYSENPAS